MNYIELSFKISPLQPASEILVSELSELGFESFVEEEDGLLAYIIEKDFVESSIKELYLLQSDDFDIKYSVKSVEDQNWNAIWESEYQPVLIDDKCYIRAPFHESKPEIEFEILIEPQMSFGTAHHETTHQMIQLLLDENLKDKSLLDMGCGTAVLAILAKMKGASEVNAIDNDEWAYRNAKENVVKNNFPEILVEQGDAALLAGREFEIILANINKNILLRDMEFYVKSLIAKGKIFFSGFYHNDLDDIKNKAESLGLKYIKHSSTNDWVAAVFERN